MVRSFVLLFLLLICSCTHQAPMQEEQVLPVTQSTTAQPQCPLVDSATVPVSFAAFVPGSYQGRQFLQPANHLGEDIALSEGFPVSAIANGRVVFAGPASGYGERLVVIEHRLQAPITVVNGAGISTTTDTFLSISGHLRDGLTRDAPGAVPQTNSCVLRGTIIGWVNDAAHNGDGGEHLHLGVRLMSDSDAHFRDGRYAYRGYDTPENTWRGDFAAAHTVIAQLAHTITWHPDGTLIKRDWDPKVYRLEGGRRRYIPSETDFNNGHFWTTSDATRFARVQTVSEEEMACYPAGSDLVVTQPTALIRCAGTRWVHVGQLQQRFIVQEAEGSSLSRALLATWGFAESDAQENSPLCNTTAAGVALPVRDGVFVKEPQSPTVYAIAQSVAWPIDTWETFVALGGRTELVLDIPNGGLARVVGMIATTTITKQALQRCMADVLASCSDPFCRSSIGGGFGVPVDPAAVEPTDAGTAIDASTPPTCHSTTELCNGVDDDCDGVIDNGFPLQWDNGNCGACGVRCDRPNTIFACIYGTCVFQGCYTGYTNADQSWANGCETPCVIQGSEVCDGQDNDCNGLVDDGIVCMSDGRDAGVPPVQDASPETGCHCP